MKTAKSFLKWAGGKTKLLPQITQYLPDAMPPVYREPFLGGGAMFFHLQEKYDFEVFYLSDRNPHLIKCYNKIRWLPERLVENLKRIETEYNCWDYQDRYYYEMRELFNRTPTVEGFIFLNKCGFNGLYRTNKKGEFNVPWGKHKEIKLFDEDNIYTCSESLSRHCYITASFYDDNAGDVNSDNFIYLDPPYRPISKTSSFNTYSGTFGDDDQRKLAEFYRECDRRGAKLMLSNSWHPEFFGELYKGFNIIEIEAPRSINSKGSKRGNIKELLITNY